MMITLNIDAEPVAKGRARSTRGGVHYTPEKTREFEALIKRHALAAGATPIDGPLCLMVSFYSAIPKSWSKKRRDEALASGGICKTSRPDLDNLVKAVQDGLNGVLWNDDAQIVDIRARKRYAEKSSIHIVVGPAQVCYTGVCS